MYEYASPFFMFKLFKALNIRSLNSVTSVGLRWLERRPTLRAGQAYPPSSIGRRWSEGKGTPLKRVFYA